MRHLRRVTRLQKGGSLKRLREDIERFQHLQGRAPHVTILTVLFAIFQPRLAPVVLLRIAAFMHEHHLALLAKPFSIVNVIVFGIEVSPRVKIGGGLFLPHTVGTVIGAESIGKNCTIMQGVTLGSSEPDLGFDISTRPQIGNDVLIGAGAKIIGRVTVSDHAKIGANAVVLCNVPAYAVAVGVPATIIPREVPTKS